MRVARSLSTRLATVGSALAIASFGLIGAAGIVGTAAPAGAAALGTTSCALTDPPTQVGASVAASITPTQVNSGSPFSVTGMTLTSELVANATTSAAAGFTLTVTFASTLRATNATPASQAVAFSGSVTLPKPFNVGDKAAISLSAANVSFTSADNGSTSTDVTLDPTGQLSADLPGIHLTGACTGPPPVTIASAPIVPAAGSITNVIPNAGDSTGGTPVKLVGKNMGGATAVSFVGSDGVKVPATDVKVLSPTVVTCVTPAGPNDPTSPTGDGIINDVVAVIITTAAGDSLAQPLADFTFVDITQGAIVSSVSPGSGAPTGGSAVTIKGFGFVGGGIPGDPFGQSVSFGTTVVDACDSLASPPVVEPCATIVDDNTITVVAPAGTGLVHVTVVGASGVVPPPATPADYASPTSPQDRFNYNPGYFLAASDGGVFSYGQFGSGSFFGSAGNLTLNKPVVGMAVTPDGGGYWLVASDGGIFSYGDATFYGSAGNLTLNKPIVAMTVTPDGAGYWLVASDGGVFTYGDALFFGSAGNLTLNKPVVGMSSTVSGNGYWLVATDGGIFAYGDAVFYGSTGGTTLNKPVVGMAADCGGLGYSLVAADGGVFSYGSSKFLGSTGAITLNKPMVGMNVADGGNGYWLVATDGGIFAYGNAPFLGSTGAITLNKPVVGMAASGVVPTSAA